MKKKTEAPAVAQLRMGSAHPFGGLRGYVPLGGGRSGSTGSFGPLCRWWMRPF